VQDGWLVELEVRRRRRIRTADFEQLREPVR
jgi:hypothetical protein